MIVQSRHFLSNRGYTIPQGVDGIWRRAVRSDKKGAIMREAHYGVARGHYARDVVGVVVVHAAKSQGLRLKGVGYIFY